MCPDQSITGLQAEKKGIPNTQEDGTASKIYRITAGIPGCNEPAELYISRASDIANTTSTGTIGEVHLKAHFAYIEVWFACLYIMKDVYADKIMVCIRIKLTQVPMLNYKAARQKMFWSAKSWKKG